MPIQVFDCQAKRQQDKLAVESLYKDGSRQQAEFQVIKKPEISGGYCKHGIFSLGLAEWKKPVNRIYCHGFPVGYHQYFDSAAQLSHVVDYAGIDYEEWQKLKN